METKSVIEKGLTVENDNIYLVSGPLEGIEKSKAEQIEGVFAPMVEMLKGFEAAYNEVVSLNVEDPETGKLAKRLRLDIGRVRIDAEKKRKELKEEYLRGGKAIDGVNNILKFAIVEKENKLKEIEDFQAIKRAKEIEALKSERESLLVGKYGVSPAGLNLGEMSEPVWSNYLTGVTTNFIAKQKAEEEAERQRKAKQKAQKLYQSRREALLPFIEYISMDILTVQTTEEAFQALLIKGGEGKDRAAAEFANALEEKEALLAEKKEREAEEAATRETERLERERLEGIATQEREERERLEAEQKEKEAAEARAIKQKEAAPDREKLISLRTTIAGISFRTIEAISAQERCIVVINDSLMGMEK